MKKKNFKKMVTVGMTVAACSLLALAGCAKKESGNGDTQTSGTTDLPVVGVLQFVSHPALDTIYEGVVDGLKEAGYEDGKDIQIEFQNGQADMSKLATMSQQLISKKAKVLVGIATPAAQALANETTEIPIVMGAVSDPVSANLVTSLDKPGGNITGVSDKSPVDAQVDLIKEILPDAKKMGILYCSAEDNSDYQAGEIKKLAEKEGFTVETFALPSADNVTQTVQQMATKVDFIYIPTDNTMANAMDTIAEAADNAKIPVIPSVDTMVEQGGVATVSINQYDLGVETGKMAAKILAGEAEPATLPVYTFTTGDIIINKKQAEKLGITIPADILKKATIVGE